MDAAQCGAFVGAMFGGASLVLCGDVSVFALSSQEEHDIGDALEGCLQTLPPQIGETISMAGPWAKLTSTLGGAVLKRMGMVAAAKAAAKAQTAAQRGNPAQAPPTVPRAPQPSDNGVRVPGVGGNWDVVAPVPRGA